MRIFKCKKGIGHNVFPLIVKENYRTDIMSSYLFNLICLSSISKSESSSCYVAHNVSTSASFVWRGTTSLSTQRGSRILILVLSTSAHFQVAHHMCWMSVFLHGGKVRKSTFLMAFASFPSHFFLFWTVLIFKLMRTWGGRKLHM